MKIVIQTSYGLGSISKEASEMLINAEGESSVIKEVEENGKTIYYFKVDIWNINLCNIIEKLGNKAFGPYTKYKVVEVNEPFVIRSYDGSEYIETLSEFKEKLMYPEILQRS